MELHDWLELHLQQNTNRRLHQEVEGGGFDGGDPSWGLREQDGIFLEEWGGRDRTNDCPGGQSKDAGSAVNMVQLMGRIGWERQLDVH